MAGGFERLFSPIRLGPVTVRNRIVSTAHHTELSRDGTVGEALVDYHEARAAGGCGLIVLECQAVHPSAVTHPSFMRAYDRANLGGYEKLARAVKAKGAALVAQIWHPGRQSTSGASDLPVLAPSALPCPVCREPARPMEAADLDEIVRAFASTAGLMLEAGLDGVEVHCTHGYLLQQFLSPFSNRRADDLGGSLENRLRFPRRVIEAVRAAAGARGIVGMRLCGDEFVPNGLEIEEAKAIARALCEGGHLDYVSVSAGNYTTAYTIFPSMRFTPGCFVHLAAGVKEVVDLPVIAAGRVNDPVQAEKILEDGQADLVGMTRAQICDPDLARKAKEGRDDEIRHCVGCNLGCLGRIARYLPLGCIQNPQAGREKAFALRPARAKKRVVVVGGGPAGMKAAETARLRGHEVHLFEKEERLGGKVWMAASVPGREEFAEIVRNLERSLARLAVPVRLGGEAKAEDILALAPDAVVLATGSEPSSNVGLPLPPIEYEKGAGIYTVPEVFESKGEVPGERVLVYNADPYYKGLAAAELLVSAGKRVTILSPNFLPGYPLVEMSTLYLTLREILPRGAEMVNLEALVSVRGGSARTLHLLSFATADRPFDALVLALGDVPFDPLARALESRVPRLLRAGDCLVPRVVEHAILEGFRAGAAI